MKDNRPVNLDLLKFHFPLPALVSIGHRISGVVLFLGMPFVLWALMVSLVSSGRYAHLMGLLSLPIIKLFLWLFCSALAYHLSAGIKHLLLDIGIAETLESARIASIICLIVFCILALLLGVWLW